MNIDNNDRVGDDIHDLEMQCANLEEANEKLEKSIADLDVRMARITTRMKIIMKCFNLNANDVNVKIDDLAARSSKSERRIDLAVRSVAKLISFVPQSLRGSK